MPHEEYLPNGRQQVDEGDIAAVVETLQSDWLTTGPAVERFEQCLAAHLGVTRAVAVSSGTAALHAAMFALGIGPGDEVILPPLTFAATANAVLYQGGTPVFADVENEGLLLDPVSVGARITPRTKAIVAVDYAGQPCDYPALRELAAGYGLPLASDACHSLGGAFQDTPVGRLADLTVFSFHPVKSLTTAEGGMVVTNDAALAECMKRFRNHGIDRDHRQRQAQGTWEYRMTDLGYNYRLSDLQCALGWSQLKKLSGWIGKRRRIVERYRELLGELPQVRLLKEHDGRTSACHLMVIRVEAHLRDELFNHLRAAGIGANVHYGLVYRHPYYAERFDLPEGTCPVAEQAEKEILSLPLFPGMEMTDVERVCSGIKTFFRTTP